MLSSLLVALVLAGSLAGCAGGPRSVAVSAPRPRLPAADAAACRAFVHALPARVDGQPRRTVEPAGAPAAAYGDPPIVVRCGVAKPHGFDRFATCQRANGVDWFIPERQQTGSPTDITMTTVGRSQYVEVRLPAAYWPPAAAMVDLAPAVKSTTRLLRPCL